MEMTRRGFLQSILAAGVMPAIVRAESIMAVTGFSIPTSTIILPNHGLIIPDAALAIGRTLTVNLHSVEYSETLAEGLIELRRQVTSRGVEQAIFALNRRLPRPTDGDDPMVRQARMDREGYRKGVLGRIEWP